MFDPAAVHDFLILQDPLSGKRVAEYRNFFLIRYVHSWCEIFYSNQIKYHS